MTQPPLGNRFDDRYRTVPEPRLLEALLLAGWVFELAADRRAEAEAAMCTTLASWIELGLPYRRSAGGERLYDPVEVMNFQKWAGRKGLDRFWIDRYIATGRRLVGNLARQSGNGARSPDRREVAAFRVSLQRRFNVGSFAPGARLRLRMPLPLPGPSVREVEIVPRVPSELGAEIRLGDGRMELLLAAPAQPFIEAGAEVCFEAHAGPAGTAGSAAQLAADEAAVYLRPTEGLIRITPRVEALANFLAGPTCRPEEIVRACFAYLIDELSSGMVHYDQVDANAPGDWVLESGWHDCQLGSALFVALCRARAIPARILGGHVLYQLAPTNHYWAEAWIEGRGWLPFDLLCWDLSAAGHDLQWRNHFAGHVDQRMVTQCLPKFFTGSMSVRLPDAWHMLQARAGSGVEIDMMGLDGSLAYRDTVSVRTA